MPLTEPVEASIEIIADDVVLQVPPVVAFDRFVFSPAQTPVVPVMAPGNGSIITVAVVRQPVGSVYVIVALPAEAPVIVPVPEPIVAISEALLVQDPPGVGSVSVLVSP